MWQWLQEFLAERRVRQERQSPHELKVWNIGTEGGHSVTDCHSKILCIWEDMEPLQYRDTFVDARGHLHVYLCSNVSKVAIGAAGGSLVLVLLLLVRTSFHMRVSDCSAQRGSIPSESKWCDPVVELGVPVQEESAINFLRTRNQTNRVKWTRLSSAWTIYGMRMVHELLCSIGKSCHLNFFAFISTAWHIASFLHWLSCSWLQAQRWKSRVTPPVSCPRWLVKAVRQWVDGCVCKFKDVDIL